MIITNDGFTLLKQLNIEHPVGKMMVELAKGQENQIGDGTTSIVLFVARLCKNILNLLDKQVKPIKIQKGIEKCWQLAKQTIEQQKENFYFSINQIEELNNNDAIEKLKENKILIKIGETSLNSKIIHREKNKIARMCVKAIVSTGEVMEGNRIESNLNKIQIKYIQGDSLENSEYFQGVLIEKNFLHENMEKNLRKVKIILFSCGIDSSNLTKSKSSLKIQSSEEYEALFEIEEKYYEKIIKKLKKNEVKIIVSQWSIDKAFAQLLQKNKINAVTWVSCEDLERISLAANCAISSSIHQINETYVGFLEEISLLHFGNTLDPHILFLSPTGYFLFSRSSFLHEN